MISWRKNTTSLSRADFDLFSIHSHTCTYVLHFTNLNAFTHITCISHLYTSALHNTLHYLYTTSITGFACTENCHGRMVQEYDELALHTQLKCLESLFDVPRMQNKRKLNDIA